MNKLLFASFFFLLVPGIAFPQAHSSPYISRPVYFDVSPPLRDLVIKAGNPDRNAEVRIVENRFNVLNAPALSKPVVPGSIQEKMGTAEGDTILVNFEGTGNVNFGLPPDTYGDVGLSHYFQLINYSFTIFDKAGNRLLGPTNTSTIWNGLPNNYNTGDGVVLYDEQADRWVISQFSLANIPAGPFFMMIAVSQTPDPTGSWYRWQYEFDNLPDYPKLSVWPDGYYFSSNIFLKNTLVWSGTCAGAFDRAAMLQGNPGPMFIRFFLPTGGDVFSMLPADCDGPFPSIGTPDYFIYLDPLSSRLGMFDFQVNWTEPSLSTFGNPRYLDPASFGWPVEDVPQKGTAVRLEPIDDRLMFRLQFRDFGNYQAMVVNHTVKSIDHAAVRWYEFRKYSQDWFINQQSTYDPDTNWRWMGSIAMDPYGNILLGYSIAGSDLFPSVRYTGRMKNDPPGEMTISERSIIEGGGYQSHQAGTSSRWGDYSSMTADPVREKTFWYTQEYYPETSDIGWHTRIASISLANVLDINAFSEPSSACDGDSVSLNVDVNGGSAGYSYSWRSNPPGFTSAEKSPRVLPAATTWYVITVTSGNQFKTDSVLIPVIPKPVVSAGKDTLACWYISSVPLEGSASNYITLQWTGTGNGVFDDPSALFTIYHPGPYDQSKLGAELILTAFPDYPCKPVSDTMHLALDTCLAISELAGNTGWIRIFPNPSGGRFTVECLVPVADETEITISDLPGHDLYTERFRPTGRLIERTIDLTYLPKGMYLLKCRTGRIVFTEKLILV